MDGDSVGHLLFSGNQTFGREIPAIPGIPCIKCIGYGDMIIARLRCYKKQIVEHVSKRMHIN